MHTFDAHFNNRRKEEKSQKSRKVKIVFTVLAVHCVKSSESTNTNIEGSTNTLHWIPTSSVARVVHTTMSLRTKSNWTHANKNVNFLMKEGFNTLYYNLNADLMMNVDSDLLLKRNVFMRLYQTLLRAKQFDDYVLVSAYKSWFMNRPYGANYLFDRYTYRNLIVTPISKKRALSMYRPWDDFILNTINGAHGMTCKPALESDAFHMRSRHSIHPNNEEASDFTFDHHNYDLFQQIKGMLLTGDVMAYKDETHPLYHDKDALLYLNKTYYPAYLSDYAGSGNLDPDYDEKEISTLTEIMRRVGTKNEVKQKKYAVPEGIGFRGVSRVGPVKVVVPAAAPPPPKPQLPRQPPSPPRQNTAINIKAIKQNPREIPPKESR